MIFTLKKKKKKSLREKIGRVKNSAKDSTVNLARAGVFTVSACGYIASELKQHCYEDLPKIVQWIADCPWMYRNDINFLKNFNNATAKSTAVMGAIYTAHQINKGIARLLPHSPGARKIAKAVTYPALAMTANFLGTQGKAVQEKSSVLEFLVANANDTLVRAYDSVINLFNLNNTSDAELMTATGAATLLALTLRKPIGAIYNTFGNFGSRLFGKGYDKYEEREITKNLEKELMKRNAGE